MASLVAVFWEAGQVVQAASLRAAIGSLRGRVVVVDPGHGGIDPGAIGVYGVNEDQIVVPVSEYLARLLERAGAIVLLTRRRGGDGGGRLPDRMGLVVDSGADVLVSLHGNQFSLASEHGAQVLYSPSSETSRRLAAEIQAELSAITGETRRPILPRPNLYLLKHSPVAAVIVELGFLSNAREARLLAEPVYQQRLAWAMFIGLARWFAAGPWPPPARGSP